LNSAVNLGGAQEEFVSDASIRRPFLSVFQELYENYHVLGLEIHIPEYTFAIRE
jgi:hypothetical protein